MLPETHLAQLEGILSKDVYPLGEEVEFLQFKCLEKICNPYLQNSISGILFMEVKAEMFCLKPCFIMQYIILITRTNKALKSQGVFLGNEDSKSHQLDTMDTVIPPPPGTTISWK